MSIERNSQSEQPPKNHEASEQQDNLFPVVPIRIITQFVKDISFETPGPLFFMGQKEKPDLNLDIEVLAKATPQDHYEVDLHINASAKHGDKTSFVMELVYTGLCELGNVEEGSIPPLLLIECPRLLFPFARNIVATVTREGGFPPLSLDPIDFAELYRVKVAQAQQEEQKAAAQSKK